MIKIGLVEDNTALSVLYESYLNKSSDMEVIFSVQTISDMNLAILKQGKPDVLLLDIILNNISSIDEIPYINRQYPGVKIIMLTGSAEEGNVIDAIKKGAGGYIVKSVNLNEIRDAIAGINSDGGYLSGKAAGSLITAMHRRPEDKYKDLLTPREKEIVIHIQEGLTYKEIAERMFITTFAVNQHLKKIYVKMKVKSKGELISKLLNNK
ncbi:MAG: response regulator transcription factor [Chitinophagaceae bacterium]